MSPQHIQEEKLETMSRFCRAHLLGSRHPCRTLEAPVQHGHSRGHPTQEPSDCRCLPPILRDENHICQMSAFGWFLWAKRQTFGIDPGTTSPTSPGGSSGRITSVRSSHAGCPATRKKNGVRSSLFSFSCAVQLAVLAATEQNAVPFTFHSSMSKMVDLALLCQVLAKTRVVFKGG